MELLKDTIYEYMKAGWTLHEIKNEVNIIFMEIYDQSLKIGPDPASDDGTNQGELF